MQQPKVGEQSGGVPPQMPDRHMGDVGMDVQIADVLVDRCRYDDRYVMFA